MNHSLLSRDFSNQRKLIVLFLIKLAYFEISCLISQKINYFGSGQYSQKSAYKFNTVIQTKSFSNFIYLCITIAMNYYFNLKT